MGKTFQDLLNNGQAQVLGIVSPVPMGNWLSTTQYQKLNLVRHNTATYIARTSNQNIEPGVADNWATYWMLICIDGGQVSPDGEYPEMSVGSVMHALLWGNKSYDGSSTQTITAADLGLADVYKPQGSVTFANLPATPNESNYGYVWNISDDFTTDSRFLEGAGKACPAGTNVGVIEQDGVYYYDILGAFMDLSNYAEIDGAYPTLGAGYLANGTTISSGSSGAGWHKFMQVSNLHVLNGYSAILLVNGVLQTNDGTHSNSEHSGIIEIDYYNTYNTGAAHYAVNVLAGNLTPEDFCLTVSGNSISIYKKLEQYQIVKFVEFSVVANGADTEYMDELQSSAPEGAVYAVNRNFARPLFIANQTQAKTPTVNTDMTLDGGVSPEGSLIGDKVIFYCTDGSNSYTCTGNIKSISGTTPTVTITGVVIQTISEAEHLPNNYIYAGGSSDPKWYKIATITNAPNLAAAGLLLSINGIFATQDNQYGAETGQIEFDAANASGTYSCSATLNYGNINTNNVCVVQNGSTAELYYHFDSNYQAILVTVMSFYGGSTASYELTNEGVSSAPSNAIYAVNRNFARPLFIANQTLSKTPTVNTDMTLDGGVSPDGSTIGDEVIFYCTSGSSRYTCTGKIKSISGTTPTVTITGVVTQTDIVDTTNDQTISGEKTFTEVIKAASPATGSNSDDVATTEWVNNALPHLYLHQITVTADGIVGAARFMWFSTSSAAYTLTSLCGLIYSNHSTREGKIIPATGGWHGGSTGYYMTTYFQVTSATTAIVHGVTRYISGNKLSYTSGEADVESISDVVTQLF